jgi:hypothetical protein
VFEAEGSLTPTLVLNPRDDEQFVGLCHSLLRDGIATPDGLERALQGRYPDAIVRARGLASEPVAVWYVYRDGRWINPRPPRDEG